MLERRAPRAPPIYMMRSKLLPLAALAALGLCAAASLCAALPACCSIIMKEFRRETFTKPREVADLFPKTSTTPRMRAIHKAAFLKPKGSLGMSFYTFGKLVRAEHVQGGEISHLELEAIVRDLGQPLRFEPQIPPPGVRYLIVFAVDLPAFADASAERFEDMAIVDLQGAKR